MMSITSLYRGRMRTATPPLSTPTGTALNYRCISPLTRSARAQTRDPVKQTRTRFKSEPSPDPPDLEHDTRTEQRMREHLSNYLGQSYAKPLRDVTSIIDLMQLTHVWQAKQAQQEGRPLSREQFNAPLPETEDLQRWCMHPAMELAEQQVPLRLLSSIQAKIQACSPDGMELVPWVLEDGCVDVEALDDYVAGLGSDRQQVADALRRLRRVLVLGSVQEQVLELLAPDGPGIMCAAAAAFPQRYLSPPPPAASTSETCLPDIPPAQLPDFGMLGRMSGFVDAHSQRFVTIDTGDILLRPPGELDYKSEVAQLGLRLGVLRWLAGAWYGVGPGQVKLEGRLALPLRCHQQLCVVDRLYLQELAWLEWGYLLFFVELLDVE